MRPKVLLLAITGLAVAVSWGADQMPATADPAALEARNKAVAGRVFEEIFNQGKFEVADEIYANDFVNHGLHRNFDLQQDQAAVHAEKKAFPDLKISVILMTAKDDLVTVVWVFRGTHTGSGYAGLPPTGVKVELRGITVWRVVDGKIREEWTSFDELQAAQQFVTQLKWPLLGILLVALIFAGAVCRAIARVRRPQLLKAAA